MLCFFLFRNQSNREPNWQKKNLKTKQKTNQKQWQLWQSLVWFVNMNVSSFVLKNFIHFIHHCRFVFWKESPILKEFASDLWLTTCHILIKIWISKSSLNSTLFFRPNQLWFIHHSIIDWLIDTLLIFLLFIRFDIRFLHTYSCVCVCCIWKTFFHSLLPFLWSAFISNFHYCFSFCFVCFINFSQKKKSNCFWNTFIYIRCTEPYYRTYYQLNVSTLKCLHVSDVCACVCVKYIDVWIDIFKQKKTYTRTMKNQNNITKRCLSEYNSSILWQSIYIVSGERERERKKTMPFFPE